MQAAAGELRREISRYRHGRVPCALRERQLVELAEQLFAEQGYAGASMDELARRAGVSKPVVYALMGSKEQLYRHCVERLAAELAATIARAAATDAEPAVQLRAAVGAFFGFVAEHRRVWEALAGDVTPFAAEAADVRRRQDDLVTSLLTAGAQRLALAVDSTRLEATARCLNGAMEALARWWGAHPEVGAEDVTEWAVQLVLPGLQRLIDERGANGGQR